MFWRNKKDERLNKNSNEDMAKQVFAFFLGIMMTILYLTNFGTSNLISKKSYSEYQEIEKMVNTIEKNYYEEVDRTSLYESMKYGLFALLEDGYSHYLGPTNYQRSIDSGDGIFYGYGLGDLSYSESEVIVGYVIDNSPAKAAGVMDSDIIVEVNGKTILEIGQDAVKDIFLDNENPKVDIGVKRENNPELIHFTLTKAEIEEKSVTSSLINQIGYIQLSQFITGTGVDFENAIDRLIGEGAKAFVIDLRNNGGGLFNEAITVADRILPEATITYTQKRDGSKVYFKSIDEKSLDLPIVVLVNGNSASASELVAAALKDNNAGKIYGTTTYGKGIVQETYKLNEETGFKLTTKQYLSPNGNEIHGIGVLPDVVIAQDETIKIKSEEDKQLKEAIKYLESVI